MLKAVSEILLARARATDVVARLGSDEFAVILPEVSEDEALRRPATSGRLCASASSAADLPAWGSRS